MMRCPHTLHLSAVCWKPEYWEGTRWCVTKGVLPAPLAPASWSQPSWRVGRRVPGPLPRAGAQTHQEVLLAVHFVPYVVEGLPAEPSPCKAGKKKAWLLPSLAERWVRHLK